MEHVPTYRLQKSQHFPQFFADHVDHALWFYDQRGGKTQRLSGIEAKETRILEEDVASRVRITIDHQTTRFAMEHLGAAERMM